MGSFLPGQFHCSSIPELYVLKHEYIFLLDSTLCADLYFDKAKNLNGYNLKANTFYKSKAFKYDVTKSGYNKCRGAHIAVICAVLNEMNAQITVKMLDSVGFLDNHAQPRGSLNDTLSGTVHVSLIPYLIKDFWKTQLYPHFNAKLKIISLNDSNKFADTILFILNLRFWLVLTASGFTSVFILKRILKLSASEAALEFARMLGSNSTLSEPSSSLGKVFLIITVLMAFAIGSFIQSQLTKMNTVPYQSSIDSVEDLIKTNIPIYGFAGYLRLIGSDEVLLRKRFHQINNFGECVDHFLRGDRVICVQSHDILRYYLRESSVIHISRENLVQMGMTYTCAEDLPLISRMNGILSKLSEGGFITFFFGRDEIFWARNPNEDGPTGLDLNNLTTNFYIWLGGTMSAIFIYFMEVTVYFIKKCYVTMSSNFH